VVCCILGCFKLLPFRLLFERVNYLINIKLVLLLLKLKCNILRKIVECRVSESRTSPFIWESQKVVPRLLTKPRQRMGEKNGQ
jgi:hypothetical protein